MSVLERFPVYVNRYDLRGFSRTRKSNSIASDGNCGGRRWRRDTRRTDLRVRAIELIEAGESARETARTLNIGISTAIRCGGPIYDAGKRDVREYTYYAARERESS